MSLANRAKDEDTTPDLAGLKAELESLRAQIQSFVGEGGVRARRMANDVSGTVSNLVIDGEAMARDMGREFSVVEKRAVDTVRRRPVQSVALALGIGFVAALLLRR